jgi:hypothetical protein
MPPSTGAIAVARRNLVNDFADGCEFGAAGAYVRIHGIAAGELDPAAPENEVDQGAIADKQAAGATNIGDDPR